MTSPKPSRLRSMLLASVAAAVLAIGAYATLAPGDAEAYDSSTPVTATEGIDNVPVRIFETGARLAASSPFSSSTFTNRGAKGITLYVDVTGSMASGTLVVKLQGKDPVSGKFKDITSVATASLTGAGTTAVTLYPGVAETANVSISDVLPYQWKAVATVTSGMTFSVGGAVAK